MRGSVLVFVLLVCVTIVPLAVAQSDAEVENPETKAAFRARLHVQDLVGVSLLDTTLSLVKDLRELRNVEGFDVRLSKREEGELTASLSAQFRFESLSELTAWHQSDSVQSFLSSLEQAGGEPPKLEVSGQLSGK